MFGSRISHNKHSGKLTVNLISPAPIMCMASGGRGLFCLDNMLAGALDRSLDFYACLLGRGFFRRGNLQSNTKKGI